MGGNVVLWETRLRRHPVQGDWERPVLLQLPGQGPPFLRSPALPCPQHTPLLTVQTWFRFSHASLPAALLLGKLLNFPPFFFFLEDQQNRTTRSKPEHTSCCWWDEAPSKQGDLWGNLLCPFQVQGLNYLKAVSVLCIRTKGHFIPVVTCHFVVYSARLLLLLSRFSRVRLCVTP